MQRVVDEARRLGYITTLAGRRRAFPDLTSPNATLRAAAHRQAINTMVQGSAADILRKALLAIAERIPPDSARPVPVLSLE
jgi:DNA polymerase-1